MDLILRIKKYINQGQKRTVLAKKNIIFSFFNKVISIAVSLLIVPITINYINAEEYGIWITLSSVVAWVSFFDMGFAHGFRNRFAEAKARGEIELANRYVSTTYFVFAIIFSAIFIIALIGNYFINWSDVLNVNMGLQEELTNTFSILLAFFCLNLILGVLNTLLLADQKPAIPAVIGTIGQILALIVIYVLTITVPGNLVYLALALSGVPCFSLFIASIYLFSKKYSQFKPKISAIDLSLVKGIMGLGGKFFVIQISMLFIFQFINIILSRVEGPIVVTQYNISFKYFNVIYLIIGIILTPFWSAFTEAYVKMDYQWMRKAYKALIKIWYVAVAIYICLLFASPIFYKYWLQGAVSIPFSLSAMMGGYVLLLAKANIYMFLINGIGKVQMQLYVYLFFSFISIPLMYYLCKGYGVYGVLSAASLVYIIQIIIGRIQLSKIMDNKAYGVWDK